MGVLSFLHKKKLSDLPEMKEPEKPDFSEQPFGLGIRQETSNDSDKLELIKTKIDLVNSKLENIDRRLAELERLAEER